MILKTYKWRVYCIIVIKFRASNIEFPRKPDVFRCWNVFVIIDFCIVLTNEYWLIHIIYRPNFCLLWFPVSLNKRREGSIMSHYYRKYLRLSWMRKTRWSNSHLITVTLLAFLSGHFGPLAHKSYWKSFYKILGHWRPNNI